MASGWYPGRCKDCAEPALEGAGRCEEHRVAHNARETLRRQARRAKGRCVVCGAKASPTKLSGGYKRVKVKVQATLCKAHLLYYSARALRGNAKDDTGCDV